MILTCVIELPENYRSGDVLAFHKRDPSMVSERVEGNTLRKGLILKERTACLTIRFDKRRAHAELAVDGPLSGGGTIALEVILRRMLGLMQPIEQFEQIYRSHPQLGRLIAKNPGLRVPVAATSFEALTWAVTGQQISVNAALSVRRKLIGLAGLKHSSGLYCYPGATAIAAMTETDLRQAGFSQTKARTLIAFSQQLQTESHPMDEWLEIMSASEIRERLMLVRGIGPWTVSYTLLRGFGWLDGGLHGDVAVRRGLQSLLNSPEKISEDDAKRWLTAFSPWQALVAAHLWAISAKNDY
jgi:DNA-3-methyladenine glycosylase II